MVAVHLLCAGPTLWLVVVVQRRGRQDGTESDETHAKGLGALYFRFRCCVALLCLPFQCVIRIASVPHVGYLNCFSLSHCSNTDDSQEG